MAAAIAAVHWGFSGNIGRTQEVGAHIRKVTGWTEEEFSAHLRERKAQRPAELNWILDLSMIEAGELLHLGARIERPTFMRFRPSLRRTNLAFPARTGPHVLTGRLPLRWRYWGSSTDEAEPPEITAMTLADSGRGEMNVDLSMLTLHNEDLPNNYTHQFLQFTEKSAERCP
ncbi:hypothetical protein AB7M29_005111 [Pseudomonas sp. F-14 TE3623]